MLRMYDFKCDDCGLIHEDLADVKLTTKVCPCGGYARRVITGCNFQLPKNDPGFPGAYDKWGVDRERRVKQERRNMDSFGEHKQSVKEI